MKAMLRSEIASLALESTSTVPWLVPTEVLSPGSQT